jgi:tetratricopeptide (TPR) repeat protein
VAATAVESYLEDAKAVDADEPDRFDFRLAGDTFRPSGDLVKEILHFKFAYSHQFEIWQEDGRRCLYDALPPNLRKHKAYAPLLADGPRLLDGPVACGPIVGAAESFVVWLKQQNRKFAALEMESGGVLAAVFEATDPARTLVLRGISDLADHRKTDLDQTAGGVFRRVAMNNAIGMLDALLAVNCLPRAHVGESRRDSHPVSERPGHVAASRRDARTGLGEAGPREAHVCTLRLTQTGDQVQAVLEEPGQPPRRAHAAFDFELTPQDDEDLRWYLEDFLQYPFDPAPTIAARIEARMTEIGADLFDRVFRSSEQGRQLWARVAERLSDLRVEIVAGVRDAQAVPWELLRDRHSDTVLALRAAAFVRTHDEPAEPPQPVRADAGPIRILLVICRPQQAGDVPFRSVASRLVKALTAETQALYQLDVLRPATFPALAARLREAKAAGHPYHVVHFDGHGMYAEVADRETIAQWLRRHVPLLLSGPRTGSHGYLLFEDPQTEDNLQLVDGPALGKLLKETNVPVLVLNACRSAHAEAPPQPSAASADEVHAQVRAFGSLAQEVIDCGVTGVVAMRYNVYVVTAAQFVADLYAALLQGAALGEAVTLGRKQLAADPQRTIAYDPRPLADWCVPVVYEALPTPLFPPRDARRSLAASIAAAESTAGRGGLDPGLPPPPDAGFFGRDETLLALDRAFDTQSVVLLHALAGSGKTATVAEFARWYAFTGGVEGPVLFTSFEHLHPAGPRPGPHRPSVRPGARTERRSLADAGRPARRQVALQVLQQVPVLWIWDNVEPVAGFPSGPRAPSGGPTQRWTGAWTDEEQRELADFLRAAAGPRPAFCSPRGATNARGWATCRGGSPVPPMPMQERVQLARGLAEKHGRRLTDVEDWRPLLRFTGGNPLTITVLVGQALRDKLATREQIEAFVEQLQRGEAHVADDAAQGRSRSLGASLQYGFEHAFTEPERQRLALLHFFQGFVDVVTLQAMGGDPTLLRENQEAPDWVLPDLRGVDRESWIALLDRAAEVGLLTAHGGGYYTIHPALPWFFKGLFDEHWPATDRLTATQRGAREASSDVSPANSLPVGSRLNAATRAFVEALGVLGNYYHAQYEGGNRDVIAALAAEEANLQHARQLAHRHDWWDPVTNTMQGLRVLYHHTGRRTEWARLVAEIVPEFVDAQTDGPLPGREEAWTLVTEYRVRLAEGMRDWPEAERLQRICVDWDRRRAERVVRSLWKGADGSRSEPATFLDELKAVAARLSDADRHTIRSLGVSLHELGQIQRECQQATCVAAYEEALSLDEFLGDRADAAVDAFNLGHAYKDIPSIRDLPQAERWYRRSLKLFDERDRLGRGKCHVQLGYVAFERFHEARSAGRPAAELVGHLNTALGFYHQALDLLPANAINDLARLYKLWQSVFVTLSY